MKNAQALPFTFQIPIFVASLLTANVAAANTALWIGNPAVTANTNWSDNANWSNIGTGGAGPLQNDAKFGGTGSAGDINTITSVADANQYPFSLQYTNASQAATLQFHNTLIPAGVTLSVGNGNLTVGGLTADGYQTKVKMTGGGTLLVTNGLSIGNNGSSSANNGTLLDLSGLTNFVYNASAATITMGSGNRGSADFMLANGTNYVTAATWNANTASSSSGTSGTLTLGAGTNVINVNTFNIAANRSSCTVQFPSTGGLRLRGAGGTDANRANMTVGNHSATGTGSTSAGRLLFNGHPVDMKLGTLTLGQSGAAPTAGSNPGNGTLEFDTGLVDVTTINMAVASNVSFNSANGTNTLGANGTLIVGAGGITMANLSGAAAAANGALNINGGSAQVFGNIRKATTGGTATITVTGGSLNMAAITNTIGTSAVPIDNLNLTDTTLTLPAASGTPSAIVTTLSINGTVDTINVSSVPGLGQFQLIVYSTLNGTFDFNLGSMPGTYQGYLSNNVAGLSVDLVVTNSLIKSDVWKGNVNGNWDTTTVNWSFSGGPTSYQQGDFVTFDDTLSGTPTVNLTTTLLPASIIVSNQNYVFSGSGKLSGPASLTKQGSGSLTLTEIGGDDFSGGIIVNSGTLILDNTNSAIGGGLTINGGTARIGNNDANGALPAGSVTDNGTLIFSRSNSVTVSTPISGTGSLVANGSGTLILNGVNGYTGSTIVSNGALALTGSGTVSNSSQVIVANAAFDLSALSQQTILGGLSCTNSAITVALNASGAANIASTSLSIGGSANQINVSSFPPIASYPVTFTIIQSASPAVGAFNFAVGSLPAASPAYAANVSQSADKTAVLLTVTSGPISNRPSVLWTGADLPNLNTNWSDRLNWQLPGPPGGSDNVIFNNTAAQSASALSTPGGGLSALVPENINNIADANFTLSSLIYSNATDTYHNTYVNNGKTLNITNTGGLSVGAFDAGTSAQHGFVNVAGANATMSVSHTNANVQVWIGSPGSTGSQGNLDLSALDNFSATVSRLLVGATINNVVNRPSGILYLAKTNSISAGFQTTTSETGTATANAGLVVADCNGNAGPASFLWLGRVNTISADTIVIGRQKATGHLQFNSIYANVAPYPSVTFQGFSSSRVSIFDIGDGVGNTGTTTLTADVNLSGGIVNAAVDIMNIGRASSPTSGTTGGTTTGTLTFDAGTINVNTLNIGLQPPAFHMLKIGIGTNNIGSNTVIGAAATLIVNGNLTLANAAAGGTGGAATIGALNITNGTVLANNIVAGTNGSTSTIGVYGGTLAVSNAIGDAGAPLGTLTLAPLGTPDNSRNVLQLAADATAAVTVNTFNLDGLDTTTNVLNIGSVGSILSTPVELPLIKYGAMNLLSGSTFNLGLGTLPAGHAGYLTNDTANSLIGLVITSAPPPPPVITAFSLQSGNLVISGTNGRPNTTYYVLASTNVALPLSNWTRIATNTFDGSGNFNFSAALDPTKPQRFFVLQVP